MKLLRQTLFGLLLCVLSGCAAAREARTTAVTPAPMRDFRASPPPVPPAPVLQLPQFVEGSTENGVGVLVSERHALPVVSISIAFAAGSGSDPQGERGLASLTYGLLLEGAGGEDAAALDAAFAMLGARPSLRVEPDGAILGVTVLRERASDALSLLAHVVLRSKLAEAAFEQRKAQQLADLAALSSEPSFLAQRAFLAAAYGPDHPYAHTPLGSPEFVQNISWDSARQFYSQHVGPATVAVVMTGDIQLAQAIALVNREFGRWHAPARRPPAPPTVRPQSSTPIRYIARSGLNQTTLLVGRPALAAGDPQEAPLEIATAALGGLFSSRLNLNLREQHGYSYGAKAQLSPRRGPGPWLVYTAVRADATAAALDEIMSELGKLVVRPINEREADAGRRSLVDSLPGRFETADDLTSAAAQMYWFAQPLDRYARLVAALNSATASDAEEAALLYLRPESLSIIAVGDPKVLKTQLPRLQLHPVRGTMAWMGPAERAPETR